MFILSPIPDLFVASTRSRPLPALLHLLPLFAHLSLLLIRWEKTLLQLKTLPWTPYRGGSCLMTRRGCEDSSMDALQRRIMFDDECILVYEYDNVVGHESKYNCHLMEKIEKENLLHRAFSCFLFNSNYDMLLQQRSATKVTFPLVWTDACCSHPLYCESELIEDEFLGVFSSILPLLASLLLICVPYLGVRNAAQRKLLDELGIIPEDLPVNEFTLVGRTLYKAPSDEKCGEHELDSLLFIVRDVEVNPNPDEVAGVMYVSRDQLKELLRKADAKEDGIKLSPWFRLVVNNFLMKWWDHLEKGTIHEVADMSSIHKMT